MKPAAKCCSSRHPTFQITQVRVAISVQDRGESLWAQLGSLAFE